MADTGNATNKKGILSPTTSRLFRGRWRDVILKEGLIWILMLLSSLSAFVLIIDPCLVNQQKIDETDGTSNADGNDSDFATVTLDGTADSFHDKCSNLLPITKIVLNKLILLRGLFISLFSENVVIPLLLINVFAFLGVIWWRWRWRTKKYCFGSGKLQAGLAFVCFIVCYVTASGQFYVKMGYSAPKVKCDVEEIRNYRRDAKSIKSNILSEYPDDETTSIASQCKEAQVYFNPASDKADERYRDNPQTINKPESVKIYPKDLEFLRKQYEYQHSEIDARRSQEQQLNILKITTVAFVLFLLVAFFVREKTASNTKGNGLLSNSYVSLQNSKIAAIIFWILVLINAIADTRLSYNAELTSRIGEWIRKVEECFYADMASNLLTWEKHLHSTNIFSNAIMRYASTLVTALLFCVTVWLFTVRTESVSIRGMNTERMRHINTLCYIATMIVFALNVSQTTPIQIALVVQVAGVGALFFWYGPMELNARTYTGSEVTSDKVKYAFLGENISIPGNAENVYLEISEDVATDVYKNEKESSERNNTFYSYLSYTLSPGNSPSGGSGAVKGVISFIRKLATPLHKDKRSVKSKFRKSDVQGQVPEELLKKLQSIELIKLNIHSVPQEVRHLEIEKENGKKKWLSILRCEHKPIDGKIVENDEWDYFSVDAEEEPNQSKKRYCIYFLFKDPSKNHQRLHEKSRSKL